MDEIVCPFTVNRNKDGNTLICNCRSCNEGKSTIFDETCRTSLFEIIQKEHGINRIILNHALVKLFKGKELDLIKALTVFIEIIEPYEHIQIDKKQFEKCDICSMERQEQLSSLVRTSKMDPISSFVTLKNLSKSKGKYGPRCYACITEFNEKINQIIKKTSLSKYISQDHTTAEEIYTLLIRPYVRPGFIDSFIQLQPPADAIFLESYEVQREGGRPMNVTIYTLETRPEKIYFVVPPEYDLPLNELFLLERLREYLSQHRPKDASFMNAETAEEYFKKLGKQVLSTLANEQDENLSIDRIDYLADIFSRFSAGFGILEDLLLDNRIQDIYVNAPVIHNPLHIVLEGEEYTSNVFLSDKDIDAIASRFRTLSGRAFSEASPILDMDLEHYSTRVAAISNPLTPRGIALALRRHRQKPWTLTHFIANKMISPVAAGFLSFLIDGQASLLVAGSRGAGKTSLLSALMLEIPQRFRILTIEDTPEIPVEKLQRFGYKIQSLITKSISSGTSSTEVSPSDALRTALRLGESVLILGEVRGVEAKVLFEAMRVGAAGNLIMGTIHGATTRDVYERVVYDIGVPATSFKAVDAVIIASPIRVEGGIERKRRVVQISEITKEGWSVEPKPEQVFQDVMNFDTSRDALQATNILDMGQSQVLESISKKWGITVEKALENIRLRTEIKQIIVEKSKENIELLEAEANRDANNAFWMYIEKSKKKHGSVEYREVKKNWKKWFNDYCGYIQ